MEVQIEAPPSSRNITFATPSNDGNPTPTATNRWRVETANTAHERQTYSVTINSEQYDFVFSGISPLIYHDAGSSDCSLFVDVPMTESFRGISAGNVLIRCRTGLMSSSGSELGALRYSVTAVKASGIEELVLDVNDSWYFTRGVLTPDTSQRNAEEIPEGAKFLRIRMTLAPGEIRDFEKLEIRFAEKDTGVITGGPHPPNAIKDVAWVKSHMISGSQPLAFPQITTYAYLAPSLELIHATPYVLFQTHERQLSTYVLDTPAGVSDVQWVKG